MATIYFKTSKKSTTGLKLQALINEGKLIEREITSYVKELGASEKYLMRGRCVFGTGICGVKFEEKPDMKTWKDFPGFVNYYRPRLSSKSGKDVQAKFDSFEFIDRDEISQTFGFDRFGSNPGFFDSPPSKFFGIAMDSEWNFEMPNDFVEITFTEYQNL